MCLCVCVPLFELRNLSRKTEIESERVTKLCQIRYVPKSFDLINNRKLTLTKLNLISKTFSFDSNFFFILPFLVFTSTSRYRLAHSLQPFVVFARKNISSHSVCSKIFDRLDISIKVRQFSYCRKSMATSKTFDVFNTEYRSSTRCVKLKCVYIYMSVYSVLD